jgi:hypothetical protein
MRVQAFVLQIKLGMEGVEMYLSKMAEDVK